MTRPIFTARCHLAAWLMRACLRVTPPGRYRSELNATLWALNLRVQAHCAAVGMVEGMEQ